MATPLPTALTHRRPWRLAALLFATGTLAATAVGADPTAAHGGAAAPSPTNWATDAELEGIVDLLDPDYQQQPIKVARLPVKYAVKTVYGRGRRVVYSFEDPNCGYCRQLHQELGEIGDLTVYTFVVSFLGEDSVRKADAVWCAANRASAWHRVMRQQPVAAARPDCTAPHAEVRRMIGLLGINLTPTVFFADGERMNGIKPRAEIERRLAAAATKLAPTTAASAANGGVSARR